QIATARRASRLELLSVVRLGFTNRSVEDAALRWLSGYELGSLTLPAPFRHSIRMGYVFIAIRGPRAIFTPLRSPLGKLLQTSETFPSRALASSDLNFATEISLKQCKLPLVFSIVKH